MPEVKLQWLSTPSEVMLLNCGDTLESVEDLVPSPNASVPTLVILF